MHKITHVWEHVQLVTYLSSSTQILHLNLTWQPLVLIGPFGWDWWIWNISMWQNNFKWQNNYMCLNNHKIMYFIVCLWIMIIIYYFNMIFSMIICFNNCVTNLLNKQFQFSSLALFLFFHDWIFPPEITYFEQIIMLTCLLNNNLMQTMGFWFFLHLLAHYCFWLLYMSCGFGAGLIIQQFTRCFNTLFLNSYGTHVCSLGVADWGFHELCW
jgi:hypothetical protein